MNKRFVSILVLLLVMVTGTVHGASYTLPEKMYNQLSIGSGLKGTITITAEGEAFRTPFLNAVTDAVFSIRGISSGNDIHYYIFQGDEQEKQSAVTELYRREGTYYLRSDMVPGKILEFPSVSQIVDAIFPTKGENGSASSFIAKILSLPEQERKEKWDPVLTRYQNALEFWLADFTVDHSTVKMEDGFSALDFTYEIPVNDVTDKIVSLVSEIASDKEACALLESVMTQEEKSIYLNSNLVYFYAEAVRSLNLEKPVRMNKRVSALGDLLRFKLELPLDEQSTGYQSIDIEMYDQLTVYTLKKTGEILILALPDTETLKESEYEKTLWYSRIYTDTNEAEEAKNISVRADVRKTHEAHEAEEKSHETDHYDISVTRDTTYVPQDIDLSVLPEYDPMKISIDMHYSSKYAQNSATTLEINTEVSQASSKMKIEGTIKTAAPWIFMPFEIVDPIMTGTDTKKVIEPYFEDWISNALSMISHSNTEQALNAEQSGTTESQEQEYQKNEPDDETTNDLSEDAEASPIDDPEQE